MGRYGEIWGDATFPARKRGGHSPRERLAEQRSGQSLDSAQSRVISGSLGRSESTQSLDSAVRTVPSQAGCEEEAAAEGGEGAEGAAAEATPRLVDTRPALEAEHGILYSSQGSRGHALRCTPPSSAGFTVSFSAVLTRCSEDAAQRPVFPP